MKIKILRIIYFSTPVDTGRFYKMIRNIHNLQAVGSVSNLLSIAADLAHDEWVPVIMFQCKAGASYNTL